jgi:hypothetical protein
VKYFGTKILLSSHTLLRDAQCNRLRAAENRLAVQARDIDDPRGNSGRTDSDL